MLVLACANPPTAQAWGCNERVVYGVQQMYTHRDTNLCKVSRWLGKPCASPSPCANVFVLGSAGVTQAFVSWFVGEPVEWGSNDEFTVFVSGGASTELHGAAADDAICATTTWGKVPGRMCLRVVTSQQRQLRLLTLVCPNPAHFSSAESVGGLREFVSREASAVLMLVDPAEPADDGFASRFARDAASPSGSNETWCMLATRGDDLQRAELAAKAFPAPQGATLHVAALPAGKHDVVGSDGLRAVLADVDKTVSKMVQDHLATLNTDLQWCQHALKSMAERDRAHARHNTRAAVTFALGLVLCLVAALVLCGGLDWLPLAVSVWVIVMSTGAVFVKFVFKFEPTMGASERVRLFEFARCVEDWKATRKRLYNTFLTQ